MYDSEEDELDAMKMDDSYSFSIDFDWEVQDDDGEWETLSTYMDVEAEWSDYNHGYEFSFDCPDEDRIVESGGNLVECFNSAVHDEFLALMSAEGVPSDAICDGGVAF